MENVELTLIALGLAMDAFAVAICKGISAYRNVAGKSVIVGIWFGIFQALMPAIGYFLGSKFEVFMNSFANLAAFFLLSFIGINMLNEVYKKEENNINEGFDAKTMFILAIATSIDALTIGITFSFFDVNIILASLIIGGVAFIMSFIGVIIGNKFGDKYGKNAQLVGASILILLGIKNLLEHFDIY